jgi:CubicO group peptidase (beta-lactamase class C family)
VPRAEENIVTIDRCKAAFSFWLTLVLCVGIALGRPTSDVTKAAKSLAPEDVRNILEPIREKAGLPALAAVVTRGRDVIAQGVCGVRKAGTDSAATLDDRWHLGSCTKALTATLLAVLVEEGKLRWDSTLGEVFPDVPKNEKWNAVTLEQLLAHRAGVPARLDPKGEWVEVYMHHGTPREQRAAVVRDTLSQPPQSEPGTSFAYSNGGVAIAGAMAERVADASWEDLIRAKVFAPLGMTSTGFGSPGSPDAVDEPWGHRPDGTPDREDNPPATAPAGLVHASLRDWATFVAVHTGGWREERGEGPWLLAPETLARMHVPFEGEGKAYGFGWAIGKRDPARGPAGNGTVLQHSGSNGKWYAVVWAAPERDMAVLVVCNQGGDVAAKACDDVQEALIAKYIGKGG